MWMTSIKSVSVYFCPSLIHAMCSRMLSHNNDENSNFPEISSQRMHVSVFFWWKISFTCWIHSRWNGSDLRGYILLPIFVVCCFFSWYTNTILNYYLIFLTLWYFNFLYLFVIFTLDLYYLRSHVQLDFQNTSEAVRCRAPLFIPNRRNF